MGRRAALLGAASLFAAGGALAADVPPGVTMGAADAMGVAERLIAREELGQADMILRTLATGGAAEAGGIDPVRLDVLAAEIALKRGDAARAEVLLAHVLDHDPTLAEARLGLGMALYEQRRDRRAAHHLRLAGPGLPRPLRRQAREALARIADRRVFSASLSAALAPDTNVNTATRQAEQTVFGQEQVLNDDGALARAGVGLSTSVQVAATPRLHGALRAEARTTVQLTDQSNAELDFLSYEAEAGPRYQGRRLTASVLGLAGRQRYGGQAHAESRGGRVRVSSGVLPWRLRGTADLSVRHTDYVRSDAADGVTYAGSVFLSRAFGPRTLIGGFALGARHDAAAGTQSHWRGGGGLSLTREVAGGVTMRLAPSVTYRRTDEVAAAFGARREDVTGSASFSVTKRGLAISGLSPLLTYAYTRNASTVGFYDFDRHRVNVGFTRAF